MTTQQGYRDPQLPSRGVNVQGLLGLVEEPFNEVENTFEFMPGNLRSPTSRVGVVGQLLQSGAAFPPQAAWPALVGRHVPVWAVCRSKLVILPFGLPLGAALGLSVTAGALPRRQKLYQFGILGVGRVGSMHVRLITAHPSASVSRCCDIDIGRRPRRRPPRSDRNRCRLAAELTKFRTIVGSTRRSCPRRRYCSSTTDSALLRATNNRPT